jgi:hypothetical protein
MCRFDAPSFWIEVVGAIANVLHESEGMPKESDDDEAARRFGRQHQRLAAKVADGLGVGKRSLTPGPSRGGEGSIYIQSLQILFQLRAQKAYTPLSPARGDGG